MIPLSIGSATEVYGDASRCEIKRHWVDHLALEEVSRSLRVLVQSLGDEVADDYWRNTLGPARRLAFAFCSAPLPFAQSAALAGIDWAKINRQVRLCQHFFPDSHEALASFVQKLEQLGAEHSSPLIGPLEELARQSGRLCVAMRNPRMNQPVAAYFAENAVLRDAKVISATQLRGAHACDLLAVIGPCDWHPKYVFSAPRAPAIHVISFRWIRDAWKPGPILLHDSDASAGKHRDHRIGAIPKIGGESSRNDSSPSDIFALDLLPPIPAFARNRLPTLSFPARHREPHRSRYRSSLPNDAEAIASTARCGSRTKQPKARRQSRFRSLPGKRARWPRQPLRCR